MLAGYADLEIDLMHCAKAVRGDLDLALKAMFRGRGNAQRIDVADAIARQPYHALGLAAEFEAAVAAVRYCLRIRNIYGTARGGMTIPDSLRLRILKTWPSKIFPY